MAVSRTEIRRRLDRFAQTCHQTGLRITHQRTEVFRQLAASDKHPDAETVYRQVRRRVAGISRDTVYRTLSTLEAQGLVRRTEVLVGAARYDANTDLHHHFVCTVCGSVRDFRSAALDGLRVPKSVESLGSIESAHVQVRGVCSACATRNRKSVRHQKE